MIAKTIVDRRASNFQDGYTLAPFEKKNIILRELRGLAPHGTILIPLTLSGTVLLTAAEFYVTFQNHLKVNLNVFAFKNGSYLIN